MVASSIRVEGDGAGAVLCCRELAAGARGDVDPALALIPARNRCIALAGAGDQSCETRANVPILRGCGRADTFRNRHASPRVVASITPFSGAHAMRGILLWLLGIPIPVIILLWLFHVI